MADGQAASSASMPLQPPLDPAAGLRAGTLQYTKVGLMMVIFWLLWGDFTFSLMEAVIPSILPLKLQALGASNKVMSLILATIPAAMNFAVNPVVSFRSDRFRSGWGRRIPFLFWATPAVTLALIVMAFGPEIGQWLHVHLPARLSGITVASVVLVIIGITMTMFQFFNMFVASIYFYLFSDVVPEHRVSGFMGIFRTVGLAADILYNWFVFPHAMTHMRLIFVLAAALYFAGFLMMCWRVKEGKYPPPPPLEGNRKGLWASVETYFKECYSHRFYLSTFGYTTFRQAAGACGFVSLLFALHLGISMRQLGHFQAYILIPPLLLAIPIGWLCDRFHPLRVVFWTALLMPVISLVNYFVIHDYKTMVIMAVVSLPDGMFNSVAIFPMCVLLWPKERFGQFGSADAVARSLVAIGMTVIAGYFMDFMSDHVYHGDQEYYRWMYMWSAFFQCVSFACIFYVYYYWKKHGGDEHFTPPAV